ncbi:hypothetical protein B0H14DRAFT_2820049 [Mycena olivaceomarginata]|nr:hypothetical protein B0H14DRAFT_2820049 [Mycena olivaceomarginata]
MYSSSTTMSLQVAPLLMQLQGTCNELEIMTILTTLNSDKLTITETILRDSKASLTVGRLRFHASMSVANLAKEIVKNWKAVVKEERARARATKTAPRHDDVDVPPLLGCFKESQDGWSMGSSGITDDEKRNTCIEFVCDVLASGSGAPFDLILLKASEIEGVVHKKYGMTWLYLATMRVVFVHLRDKNSPALREVVGSGDLPVTKFIEMVISI